MQHGEFHSGCGYGTNPAAARGASYCAWLRGGNVLPHARQPYRHDAAAAMPNLTTLQLLTHGKTIQVHTSLVVQGLRLLPQRHQRPLKE
jgi:hypothetical protein